jgi:hypothetical protein
VALGRLHLPCPHDHLHGCPDDLDAADLDQIGLCSDVVPATVVAEAYRPGRRKAEAETGLGGLPESCPWTIDQVLDHAFWSAEGDA